MAKKRSKEPYKKLGVSLSLDIYFKFLILCKFYLRKPSSMITWLVSNQWETLPDEWKAATKQKVDPILDPRA